MIPDAIYPVVFDGEEGGALDLASVVLDPVGPREFAGMQRVIVEGNHGAASLMEKRR
jgi:hypothetical protein